MLKLRRVLRQMRVGIAATIIIVGGTALYVRVWGPLYGAWGWPELVLGALILAACGFAGIESFFRQPNPYTRTYVLYNLRDVTPHRDLESGGIGWLIQAIPLIATAVILALVFWLT